MIPSPDRAERWLADLDATLRASAELVSRGREAFDGDPALPLAFEALANRVGDLSKRLVACDGGRFHEVEFSLAAKNRDFVVHHDDRLDRETLWQTVTRSFPLLHSLVQRHRVEP
ncbi:MULTISPECIES: hypothetical protein [unclassified Frigoribacterium]|uniref:hypothetical protein n=1 Tax=unclassified Frigoribacterium TaxID=2627005 RepID=UPI0006F79A5A|nr:MULTISPECIES: hypothetical protein [unclassified Frigoribacterium]KQO46311.1 hypothetical protein ASF07_00580 [Frigoribacterium sp. Leaf254]KQT38404.1 hypothetical protein ASG28_00580 [Frigoribacterium sp. Leaf415]